MLGCLFYLCLLLFLSELKFKSMKYLRAFYRLAFVFFGSWAFVNYSWLKFKFKGRTKKGAAELIGKWSMKIVRALNIEIDLQGTIPEESCLVLPNHRGYLDVFIMMGLCPSAIVAKKEISYWPVLHLGFKLYDVVLVNRSSQKSRMETLQAVKKEISEGGKMILFPEGTTHKGPLTKKFKSGTFRIAAELGAKVVPVAIEFYDDNDSWINEDTFVAHFFRQMGKKKTRVKIRFGELQSKSDFKELMCSTQSWIDNSLLELRKEFNKA